MLNKRLVKLREEKGLLKKEMAEILCIDESTYGKYELGKREPDFDTLINLAKFFNVTTDYLLGISDIRNCTECQSHKKPDELSDREKSLIELYRQLPEFEQGEIKGQLKEIVRTYKQITSTSEKEKHAIERKSM